MEEGNCDHCKLTAVQEDHMEQAEPSEASGKESSDDSSSSSSDDSSSSSDESSSSSDDSSSSNTSGKEEEESKILGLVDLDTLIPPWLQAIFDIINGKHTATAPVTSEGLTERLNVISKDPKALYEYGLTLATERCADPKLQKLKAKPALFKSSMGQQEAVRTMLTLAGSKDVIALRAALISICDGRGASKLPDTSLEKLAASAALEEEAAKALLQAEPKFKAVLPKQRKRKASGDAASGDAASGDAAAAPAPKRADGQILLSADQHLRLMAAVKTMADGAAAAREILDILTTL